jgi:flagellar hook protein FlgE
MQRADTQFTRSAGQIARAGAQATDSSTTDTVDLSTATVTLLQARNDFADNLQTAHTADEMTQATLDLLA